MPTLKQIAELSGVNWKMVGDVLFATGRKAVSKETREKVLEAAKKLGVNLAKTQKGGWDRLRSVTIGEVLDKVELNATWGRKEIVRHLRSWRKKPFGQEFREDDWI